VTKSRQGTAAERQALAATTFVEIVDALVDDFDVIDVLTGLASRSVQLLDVAAAGILLADSEGDLRVMAASSDQVGVLELFQVQNRAGPCFDCYTSGKVIAYSGLDDSSPWPEFARESAAAGFQSVCALPLRLRSTVLGCLNLFMTDPTPLDPHDIALAQALADVASVAIVQDQASRNGAIREGKLQHALDSRIVIEQAKGMIAEHGGLTMDQAFTLLRNHARHHNLRLGDLAQSVVSGGLSARVVSTPAANRPHRIG
jgi:transcriptional regulator with GAF, ATPase, and Fis domain